MARWFRALMRWGLRAVAVVMTLVFVLLGGGLLFTTTDAFLEWLRASAEDAATEALQGRVRIASIEGSVWSDLRMRGVAVDLDPPEGVEASPPILQLEELRLRFDLRALSGGVAKIEEFSLQGLRLRLLEEDEGRWNLQRALEPVAAEAAAPPPDAAPGALPVEIDLRRFVIRDAAVDLSTKTQGRWQIDRVALSARLRADAAGFRATLETLELRTAPPQGPAAEWKAALAFDSAQGGSVDLSGIEFRSPASRIQVRGQVSDFAAPKLDLNIEIGKLAAREIGAWTGETRLRPDLSGELRAKGPLAALTLDAKLRGGGATLDAQARLAAATAAGATAAADAYEAELDLAEFDLERWVAAEAAPKGRLGLKAKVSGAGADFGSLRATLDLRGRGLAAAGREIGTLDLKADVAKGRAELDLALLGPGSAKLRGSLEGLDDLESGPRFDLKLELAKLDVAALVGDASTEAELSLAGTLRGQGRDPATMGAVADLEIAPSTLGGRTIDGGRLRAELAKSRLRIDTLDLEAEGSRLAARGTVDVDVEQPDQSESDLRLELRAPSITPWLRVAGTHGAGSLEADITVGGRLSAPRVGLDVRGEDLRLAGRTYDSIAIVSALRVEADRLQAEISRLDVAFAADRFELAGTAKIEQKGERISISGFRWGGAAGSVVLEGVIGSAGAQDLLVEIRELDLVRLLPEIEGLPSGLLAAEFRVAGSARRPTIEGDFEVREPAVGEHAFEIFEGEFRVGEGSARTRVLLRRTAAESLELVAALPLSLRFDAAAAGAAFGAPLEARLVSKRLDLSLLGALPGSPLREVKGHLEVDLEATGPLDGPEVKGRLRLVGLSAKVPATGTAFRELELDAELRSGELLLRELSAKSGADGTLRGSGAVALEDLAPVSGRLELTLDRWLAVSNPDLRAVVAADLQVAADSEGTELRGSAVVQEATFRPQLDLLEDGPVARDPTIEVVYPDAPEAAEAPPPPAASPLETVALDLELRIERNTWVRHRNAEIELSGELRIQKALGGEIGLGGEVRTVRGWAGFKGRRFDLARGRVRFDGGSKIDPSLDVVAQHRLPDVTVIATVSGFASDPDLALSSKPELEQADILSTLLFGKPAGALEGGEQVDLQREALGMSAGFAAQKVGAALSDSLGLAGVGVDLRDVDVGADGVSVGHYLNDRTYISVRQGFDSRDGRRVAIEFEVTEGVQLEASSDSKGESGADLKLKKQY